MVYSVSYPVGPFDNVSIAVVFIVLLGSLVVLKWRRKEPAIPIVNSYPGDLTLKKARAEFMSNARGLIKEGIQKASSILFQPDPTI